ncbi:hypothetical protein Vadar_015116 [Vaccinium darrowii]|uniref:Uncharacterized protein n=1 Tax=Vaccinium darrowii TaxID=229202 RepID=A0ACB7XQS0_9ERIC|nr:hypothetical protein Vadar_015116 [Vaccinium darrowii]
MYVTRPLSQYLSSPELLSLPPEGPNSGYLVIQDEESVTTSTCFGLSKNRYLIDLPFPQNKNLTVDYSTTRSAASFQFSIAMGPCSFEFSIGRDVSYHDATLFIPVLNQPLSSNRYYAIKVHGQGEAYACFSDSVQDVYPRPLDPNGRYQQFEIVPCATGCGGGGTFTAKSVAPDGFPPHFLRRSGWKICTKTPKTYELGEALGINNALRACLPDFDSSLIVGKWYCPCMFIRDGSLRDQMKQSLFYEMTLERRWEKIFTSEKSFTNNRNSVYVETEVQREMVFVGGMKWEEARGGWVRGKERKVRVSRMEEFEGMDGGWTKFGCYVLVERFVLKRMDGSVVLTYDFKHTDGTAPRRIRLQKKLQAFMEIQGRLIETTGKLWQVYM